MYKWRVIKCACVCVEGGGAATRWPMKGKLHIHSPVEKIFWGGGGLKERKFRWCHLYLAPSLQPLHALCTHGYYILVIRQNRDSSIFIHATLIMVSKGCMNFETRGIPYLSWSFDSFNPLFFFKQEENPSIEPSASIYFFKREEYLYLMCQKYSIFFISYNIQNLQRGDFKAANVLIYFAKSIQLLPQIYPRNTCYSG